MKEFIVNIPEQTEPVNFTKECKVQAERCQAVKVLKGKGFNFKCVGTANGPSYIFSNPELLGAYALAYAAMAQKLCDNCKGCK